MSLVKFGEIWWKSVGILAQNGGRVLAYWHKMVEGCFYTGTNWWKGVDNTGTRNFQHKTAKSVLVAPFYHYYV